MSLTDYNCGLSAADVAAVTGNNNGFGFGNDGAWWILILFLFASMNGGWNNGYGGGANGDLQRGFDQQSVMSGITGLNTAVTNGFTNAEVARCNSNANLLGTISTLSKDLQQCCCDNRASIADLKYTVASENCSDRSAINDAARDIIAAQTANTQAIVNGQNAGFQTIADKLCQLELDNQKQRNADLLAEVNALKFAQSQTAQTATLMAGNTAQTAQIISNLNPTPIPAYIVQNPSCCNNQTYSGCGCA